MKNKIIKRLWKKMSICILNVILMLFVVAINETDAAVETSINLDTIFTPYLQKEGMEKNNVDHYEELVEDIDGLYGWAKENIDEFDKEWYVFWTYADGKLDIPCFRSDNYSHEKLLETLDKLKGIYGDYDLEQSTETSYFWYRVEGKEYDLELDLNEEDSSQPYLEMKFSHCSNSLRITVDGEIYGIYSLSEQLQQIVIGDTNVCVIEDWYCKMTEASCPKHICMESKKIRKDGEMIVCLPNKVVLEIISDDEGKAVSDIDAIVG